jgi:hypothetical protein
MSPMIPGGGLDPLPVGHRGRVAADPTSVGADALSEREDLAQPLPEAGRLSPEQRLEI